MKALNFTNLCSDLMDVEQIKKSLEFYNEEFSLEKVIGQNKLNQLGIQ